VPELLAFPLPIGFDTIYYANIMKSGVIVSHWSAFFTSPWLLNAMIVPLYSVTQADPFLLLKGVAPSLFSLNVAGIYWFSRKALGWKMRTAFVAGMFFALQLASLRISWDLLRNTLGLGLLLFALSYVKEIKSKRGFALFASLSLLSVFAHELAAVTLLVVVFGLIVWRTAKKRMDLETKRLMLGVLPALTVFLVGIYFDIFPFSYASPANVIVAKDFVGAQQGPLFFMVNYFRVLNPVDSYASYWSLALSVGVLFAVLYLPYLFLVVKGFFRNQLLTLWTCLLLVGAIGCLIMPFFALFVWYRWMFMLVYPFTFYAVYGLSKIFSVIPPKRSSYVLWLHNKKVAGMVMLTFILGITYLATPLLMVHVDMSLPSATGTYLYFSTNPTVPYQDVNGVVQSMFWLNRTLDASSCVVLHESFRSWGELYIDTSHSIVSFGNNANLGLATALSHNFTRVYFVWWNKPIGWYNISVPEGFVGIQDFDRITVYVNGGITVG
jgi:hypothetical protein